MTDNINLTADADPMVSVICDDNGRMIHLRSARIVEVPRSVLSDPYELVARSKNLGTSVSATVKDNEHKLEQLENLRSAMQSAIDEIRDQLQEGNSVTIGDWDDLGAYFGAIPGIDAGPPIREFSGSVTISATISFEGRSPKKMTKEEVTELILNSLDLFHDVDVICDPEDDELFEVEQSHSAVDFEANSIKVSFGSI